MILSYFKQFFIYFKEEKKPFLIYSILSVLASVFELFGVALVYPFILRILSDKTDSKSTILLGILITSMFLLKNAFMILFTYIQTRYTNNLEIKIKKRIVRFFLGASYQQSSKISLAEKNKILDFLVPNTMINFIFRLLNLNVNFFIFILISLCLAVKFPLATVLAIVFGTLMLGVQNKFFASYLKKLAQRMSQTNLLFNQATNDALLNIKSLKISQNEKFFYDNYAAKIQNYFKNCRKSFFLNTIPPYITEPFAIILLFLFIVVIAYQNYLEPDKLVASFALVGAATFRLAPAISRIQVNLNGINSALPLVKEFMDAYENLNIQNIPDLKDKTFADFNNSIEIKDLSFGYTEDKKVLRNINLKINKGDFIGIAGLSGVGKTTLADIIAGLYKPDTGCILIDGKEQINPLKIGYVPQDFCLINGNIRENVAFGNPVIEDDKVIEALKKSQLYDYINQNYTDGIYTNPFVDSTGFSHGQKQRLAIARALYSNPDILILDEATSSLDIKTEDEICSVLNNLKRKMTIIVIAHRLTTIKSTDKIVFMENGTIADINNFEYLSQTSEGFSELLKLSQTKIS